MAGTTEPVAVPRLLVSKARESVVTSNLAGFTLCKARTLSSLAVPDLAGTGAAKSVAVAPVVVCGLAAPAVAMASPSLSRSGVTWPVTRPCLAAPSLASRARNSVPVSSLDAFGVAKLTAKLGLLVAIVAKYLTVPGLVVSRVAKSMAIAGSMVDVALWRCNRGLGIPLDLDLPLPGEGLVGTWAVGGTGCL